MKKVLVFLMILALVLVSCETQTKAPETNTGGGSQGSAPGAPGTEQTTTQLTTTTTVTQGEGGTAPELSALEQEILDKIDWDSVKNGTIILMVKEFNAVEYVNFHTVDGWRLFVPSKKDLLNFIENYDYEIITLTNNGKTIYIFKEIGKKLVPITDALSLLPPNILEAYENLLDDYPSSFSKYATSSGRGTGGEGCGETCG